MVLLNTNLVFAVRCVACGKIQLHNISTFNFSENNKISLYCDCGNSEINIILNKDRNIKIDIPCIACDKRHSYIYNLKDIFRRKVFVICCEQTGLELCFWGREKEVTNTVLKYQQDLNKLLEELVSVENKDDEILKNIINKIQ